LYRPEVVGDGWLIRVDRRRIWPQTETFVKLDAELQKLAQIEPYFHTVGEITVKEKQTVVEQVEVQVKTGRQVKKFFTQNGRRFFRWEPETRTETRPKEVTKDVDVKKFGSEFSLHLLGDQGDQAPVALLATASATPGFEVNANPIMRADWFMFIVTSALPEDNGRYYEFRLVSESTGTGENRKSAEQLWLEGLGVDYSVIQKLRADQRIAKWRSGITGRPRAVEYFFAPSARPSVGPAGVSITRDYNTGRVDPQRHVMKNLLNYSFDGCEAMGFLPNGMMSFALFDGKGNLQRFAPEKLVTDRTVPSPHSAILQPPISCYRCHGTTDMWMDATNDIYALSKGPYGLNLYDDESDDKKEADDTLDRLVGLYAGDMDEFLRMSRNTHAKATFIVTGGMTIPAVAKKIAEVYGAYRYNAVTPQVACLELGWVVTEEHAVEHFNTILPLMPKNRHGIHPESVTIGTLRAWTARNRLHVNRDDWEQEYADAMLRVQTQTVRLQASQRPEGRAAHEGGSER
jgi:hypothetical protein